MYVQVRNAIVTSDQRKTMMCNISIVHSALHLQINDKSKTIILYRNDRFIYYAKFEEICNVNVQVDMPWHLVSNSQSHKNKINKNENDSCQLT